MHPPELGNRPCNWAASAASNHITSTLRWHSASSRREDRTCYNLHGAPNERWTEEYQANIYAHQLIMLDRIPQMRGMSPWILMDFRSPRRPLPGIQDFFNRKGLISEQGQKKKAFFILQKAYMQRTIGKAE